MKTTKTNNPEAISSTSSTGAINAPKLHERISLGPKGPANAVPTVAPVMLKKPPIVVSQQGVIDLQAIVRSAQQRRRCGLIMAAAKSDSANNAVLQAMSPLSKFISNRLKITPILDAKMPPIIPATGASSPTLLSTDSSCSPMSIPSPAVSIVKKTQIRVAPTLAANNADNTTSMTTARVPPIKIRRRFHDDVQPKAAGDQAIANNQSSTVPSPAVIRRVTVKRKTAATVYVPNKTQKLSAANAESDEKFRRILKTRTSVAGEQPVTAVGGSGGDVPQCSRCVSMLISMVRDVADRQLQCVKEVMKTGSKQRSVGTQTD